MKRTKAQCPGKMKYLSGKRILPKPISVKTDIIALIDNMDAYNGGRLRAACHLLRERYSKRDVTVGMSLAGALTPAGLGPSAIIPLMNHGFVDWITATGANIQHVSPCGKRCRNSMNKAPIGAAPCCAFVCAALYLVLRLLLLRMPGEHRLSLK